MSKHHRCRHAKVHWRKPHERRSRTEHERHQHFTRVQPPIMDGTLSARMFYMDGYRPIKNGRELVPFRAGGSRCYVHILCFDKHTKKRIVYCVAGTILQVFLKLDIAGSLSWEYNVRVDVLVEDTPFAKVTRAPVTECVGRYLVDSIVHTTTAVDKVVDSHEEIPETMSALMTESFIPTRYFSSDQRKPAEIKLLPVIRADHFQITFDKCTTMCSRRGTTTFPSLI